MVNEKREKASNITSALHYNKMAVRMMMVLPHIPAVYLKCELCEPWRNHSTLYMQFLICLMTCAGRCAEYPQALSCGISNMLSMVLLLQPLLRVACKARCPMCLSNSTAKGGSNTCRLLYTHLLLATCSFQCFLPVEAVWIHREQLSGWLQIQQLLSRSCLTQ